MVVQPVVKLLFVLCLNRRWGFGPRHLPGKPHFAAISVAARRRLVPEAA
jgi:hypothetical protein